MIALLLGVHLICAAAATLAFWAAAAAQGRRLPSRAGRSFSRLIYCAALTGGTMALCGLAVPSWFAFSSAVPSLAATRHLMCLVIYFLVVIVAPVQHGVAVVAAGPVPALVRSRVHLVLNLAAIVGTVALFPAAIIWHAWPFFFVVPAGFIVGVKDMQYASSLARPRRRAGHLTSMVTAGIALHTRFCASATRWQDSSVRRLAARPVAAASADPSDRDWWLRKRR
jgi:hypothetical protein